MTDNERDARAAEAERLWHAVAIDALGVGDVDRAIAAVYAYGADLARITAQQIGEHS
jgi:hypothetical protein